MADYTLYIDESETFNKSGNKYFVMSGVIIKNSDYPNIQKSVELLKKKIWDNAPECEKYILHEKDIGYVSNPLNSNKLGSVSSYNYIFQDKKKVILLYNELSKLFKSEKIYTIGVCLDKSALNLNYMDSNLNNQLTIAIQLLVENYCHFLLKHNATGDICYESMQPEQNMKIQQRLYELKALGTLYYSPKTIQNFVREIKFIPKSSNLVGLQLADFVPNTLGRYAAMMKPKNRDFAKSVRSKLYDGGQQGKYKYGFKILA